jgi:hypothetical protein
MPSHFIEARHALKKITCGGRERHIVLQERNGPCPLIAVTNALILLGKLQLRFAGKRITADEMIAQLEEYLVSSNPHDPQVRFNVPLQMPSRKWTIAGAAASQLDDYREKDLIRKLPSYYEGLTVSPIFGYVDGFESREASPNASLRVVNDELLFTAAGLRVVHVWFIPDRADHPYYTLRTCSYDELMNRRASGGTIEEEFLKETESQITPEGVRALRDDLREGDVCVLFRNNHFSTLVKLHGRLMTLASDEGYSDLECIVFGDECFISGGETATYYDGDGNPADVVQIAVQQRIRCSQKAFVEDRRALRDASGRDPTADDIVSRLEGRSGFVVQRSSEASGESEKPTGPASTAAVTEIPLLLTDHVLYDDDRTESQKHCLVEMQLARDDQEAQDLLHRYHSVEAVVDACAKV